MDKRQILEEAKTTRIEEVLTYQINIDNYKLALLEIEKSSEEDKLLLSTFKEQLLELLKSSLLEQKKANIMLTVISNQLESL